MELRHLNVKNRTSVYSTLLKYSVTRVKESSYRSFCIKHISQTVSSVLTLEVHFNLYLGLYLVKTEKREDTADKVTLTQCPLAVNCKKIVMRMSKQFESR